MTIPLVIVGAGGLGREVAELVRALIAVGPAAGRSTSLPVHLAGFLDDDPRTHGSLVGGSPVLGDVGWLDGCPDVAVTVGIASPGDPGARGRLVRRLGQRRWTTLVHPSVDLPDSIVIGEGSIVHAGSVLTADVSIGSHVVVMPSVVMTHDDVVGDGSIFGSGARLAGGVSVGRSAYIGSGASIREGLRIGDGAVVGMGSVVTSDVPPGEVWAGVPARRLRGPGVHS